MSCYCLREDCGFLWEGGELPGYYLYTSNLLKADCASILRNGTKRASHSLPWPIISNLSLSITVNILQYCYCCNCYSALVALVFVSGKASCLQLINWVFLACFPAHICFVQRFDLWSPHTLDVNGKGMICVTFDLWLLCLVKATEPLLVVLDNMYCATFHTSKNSSCSAWNPASVQWSFARSIFGPVHDLFPSKRRNRWKSAVWAYYRYRSCYRYRPDWTLQSFQESGIAYSVHQHNVSQCNHFMYWLQRKYDIIVCLAKERPGSTRGSWWRSKVTIQSIRSNWSWESQSVCMKHFESLNAKPMEYKVAFEFRLGVMLLGGLKLSITWNLVWTRISELRANSTQHWTSPN